MRISSAFIGLLALVTPLAAAFSKEDQEIFRVRAELLANEGQDVTFYDFLGVSKSATQDEINKAYKKRSRSLHPDKVKQQLNAERVKAAKEKGKKQSAKGSTVTKPPSQGDIKKAVKRASEQQARLSIVTNILRGPGRERYDHYMHYGFPVWKGTGYYFERYRPGLGTVMVGLLVVAGGGIHYIALYMSWKQHRDFVARYIKYARYQAWGDNLGIPGIDNGGGGGARGASASPAAPASAAASDDEEERPMPRNRRERRLAAKEQGQKKTTSRRRAGRKDADRAQSEERKPGPQGARRRVVAENGKTLVVDSLGDVYLEEPNEEDGTVEAFLLDPNEMPQPTIKDTALVRLPIWAFNKTIGRVLPQGGSGGDEAEADADDDGSDDGSDPAQHTPSTGSDDFELVDKSVDELGQAKSTGAQQGAAKKRKGKKK